MTTARHPRVLSSVANSDTIQVLVGGDPAQPGMATKAVLLEDADIADDLTVVGDTILAGPVEIGSTDTERLSIKGVYFSNMSVTVPTIADAECDVVAVDISALTFTAVVGDLVLVCPTAALPTDCLLGGAYISDTDTLTISFMTKEGGSGVTGAAKAFNIAIFDIT